MTRNSMNARNGLVKSVMLVVVAGSLGLVGCGSDLSTAPVVGTYGQNEPGELIRPTKDARVESPAGFKAESLGGVNVSLTWAQPRENGLTAIVALDGLTIAQVSASSGVYLDTMGKPSGDHSYEICFMRGKVSGRPVTTTLTITPQSGGNDGGRSDDHPELDD